MVGAVVHLVVVDAEVVDLDVVIDVDVVEVVADGKTVSIASDAWLALLFTHAQYPYVPLGFWP